MRERSNYFVNGRPLQLALRALRTDLSNRRTWVVLVVLSVILGVSGPFQTYEYFGLTPRVAYWSGVVVCTYCIGSLISDIIEITLASRPVWPRLIITAIVLAVFVTVFIVLANGVAFGQWADFPQDWLLQFLRIGPICAAIVIGSHFFVEPAKDRAAPPLLSRLDYENRGELVALSVSDHYVNVMTTKGSQLVLIRLSDAIKETAPAEGMQVHRSHWIGLKHVQKVQRDADRALCLMTKGYEIPVSRSYMPKIRDAGLLPR